MKKSTKGFTLMEMLIVVAILIILLAIAIPSFSTSLSKSKAAACGANRRSSETILQSKIMLDEIEPSELNDEFSKMGITCPAKGSLHVKYSEETQIISVECSKHTETITQGVLNKFIEMCKNFKDYSSYESNSELRKAMFALLGNTWNSIGFNGDDTNYYIQPYWNTTSNEMYVFAGTKNTADGSWYTGYIYNSDTATWYHGPSFSFVGSSINGWDDVWDTMQNKGWKPVEVEYEK